MQLGDSAQIIAQDLHDNENNNEPLPEYPRFFNVVNYNPHTSCKECALIHISKENK